ncbi:MAG: UDP-glucose--hexose-1-phosphate uridylyltransferase [Chloroflexi bacterium AL-W]|nr:UDP-glucose--hexose-1-phosphate uridylyltransferase [Chloroflexi bacterium AL-N1]NOK69303.1 UDP-glucose--hexose-1-phosphate uridylyltransferase [Chloroflexi bacterium AL-N10]NOK76364.1 UDP-glucose--hexose-1-phosphate uridylyltransferase [Chloroflexi bacterium AL-N5]NOK83481.1 UDP-glucose--hexose-1-phosphate uridylyltransferase [Chloroflexi bacterium AL-W]NOK91141.1 UDP-glucose--hexose-1-phosphate uridylyltransferase [Chloroflexi bacterium AL-N15]
MFNLNDHPHRRYNPLTREWVLVSPHRTQRPWQGQIERPAQEQRPIHDPQCYLCPGNTRAGGTTNPQYEQTFVFTNDYAALLSESPDGSYNIGGLLHAESERGTCRVVCFSPRHDLTMAEMDVLSITAVVEMWIEQYGEMGAQPLTNYVQIFENRGAMMGASNPHPHGQIWATEHLPLNVARELETQHDYYVEHERTLLADYLKLELEAHERLVCHNNHFVALVPFWAVWPFETMLISRRPAGALSDLDQNERGALADILKQLTTRYDNLFEVSFPYSMGFHQRPTDGGAYPEWHLHAHFYPPLLRSATVRKFMVGFELLAEPQRDITPEQAAERLRSVPEKHYREEEEAT